MKRSNVQGETTMNENEDRPIVDRDIVEVETSKHEDSYNIASKALGARLTRHGRVYKLDRKTYENLVERGMLRG